MRKKSQQVEKLSKFLAYVLGRRPDEFGLVPDDEGFVKLKVLLQALHEEQGWRHIRHGHLNEAAVTLLNPSIQIEDRKIRALERSGLPTPVTPETLPKLLYLTVRRRAYPIILEKGITAPDRPRLILSDDPAMALRMGRRGDNEPILLTIRVADAADKGICFQIFGQHLFLTDSIPAGTFSGPPLPKERPGAPATATKPMPPLTPGSYFPELEPVKPPKPHAPHPAHRKEPDWKKERRRARKEKVRWNKP